MEVDFPSLFELAPNLPWYVAKNYCHHKSTVLTLFMLNLDISLFSNYIKEVETWLHIRLTLDFIPERL